MIYFIKHSVVPYVKIGAANNTRRRLSELQVASPFPLEIIAETEGDEDGEEFLHMLLESARVRGEWFRSDDSRVASLIEHVRAGGNIADWAAPTLKAIDRYQSKVGLLNSLKRMHRFYVRRSSRRGKARLAS